MDKIGVKLNKDYIIWSLISIPILVGIFFIIRHGLIRAAYSVTEVRFAATAAPMRDAPATVKGIYFTSTSGGSSKKIDELIKLAENSELNSVVIDIKDSSGYLSYDSDVAEAEKYGTEYVEIKDMNGLVKKLHENNIYVIARMAVFQDPILAKARPDWAVKDKYTGGTWYDRKKLAWIDPSNREAWKYFADIAKDALKRGIDEINFDYIRFPSDGDIGALSYPGWTENMTRPRILAEFYKFMRTELGDARMSIDLFGFVTTRTDDFGVGQVMEDAFEYFDYISPMVYPSHYPNGFLKFANPAMHPYDVVYGALKTGNERLNSYRQRTGNIRPHIRPWLQDFDLGADYTAEMVRAEIKASQDALGGNYKGFMLWNARNVYSDSVFK